MNLQPASQQGILGHFLKWEKETPDNIFLRQPQGQTWREYSWQMAGAEARRVVASLQRLGLPQGSKIAILSQNCADWVICDLAIMMGGYISVPLYANVNAENLAAILIHSEARLLFVGKLNKYDWENVRSAIPATILTVTMRGYEKEFITSWSQFLQPTDSPAKIFTPTLDSILTLIYTSGTTGTPKGVIHTYGTVIKAIEAGQGQVYFDQPGNRFFSYLPLSHAAERGLVEFGSIYSGGSISFVESVDTFAANIQDTLPTHFLGVPRIWEKFQHKILQKLPQKRLDWLLKIPGVSYLVRRQIKKSLGLQKAIVILTGAAPISPDLMRWFSRLGITIREAYGMTENFNVCSINPAGSIRVGTAGKIFDHQEVSIDPDTNEILQRSEWIMKGYYKDTELTAQTIRDGFLHTGDMGTLSQDGYLTLTGRVKDIFKTSKGEYIVPQATEMQFLSLQEVDQACLLGVKYPQPFLVVVLSETGKAMARTELTQSLQTVLAETNKNCMGYQKLKKVIIVKEEWTTDNNLLTPSLKIKRNALSAKYEADLHQLYHAGEIVSWE